MLEEGVGQGLILQVLNGLLQGDHVRLVDGVDAEEQRRAVGHRGVLRLFREHGGLVGVDVRLVEFPLDAVRLPQVELAGAGAVAAGEAVVDLQHVLEVVGCFEHLPRRAVEEIPHGRGAEEKRLPGDKELRAPLEVLLRLQEGFPHALEVGEGQEGRHHVPLAQHVLVAILL